jgi:hypothetical protein
MALTTEHPQVLDTPTATSPTPPRRSRRPAVGWAAVIAALAATGVFAATVLNDTPDDTPPNPQVPAVEAARGSDRHLELLAADIARRDEARQQAIEAARGSDRHLELLAAELAGEAEARQQAIDDARGSDRHLELLADELARRAGAARAD